MRNRSPIVIAMFYSVEKTINWLHTRTRPPSLPNTKRHIGIETMVFKVMGVVLPFKRECDEDFHVIITQSINHSSATIIESRPAMRQCL